MVKCTLEQAELKEKYMGLYTNGQMIIHTIYGQISYHYCHSYAFKGKLAHDLKIFWFKIRSAMGNKIAECVIRPADVLPASHVNASCEQLVIVSHRLWKDLKRVEERSVRRMVGKRMILASM
jgi:hypothetical protein